ncbi:MAG: hypothetical protein I3I94_09215 [Acidaminococcaceae bacterium]|nr:hypothetical protein [Acidaminococcaceae bacterium]
MEVSKKAMIDVMFPVGSTEYFNKDFNPNMEYPWHKWLQFDPDSHGIGSDIHIQTGRVGWRRIS